MEQSLPKWDKQSWRDNFPYGKLISGDKNGTAELRWSNASYKGKLKNGYPDGYGVLTYDWYEDGDPDIYKGYWKTGLRHGHGVDINHSVGVTQTGKWNNDDLTGYGVQINTGFLEGADIGRGYTTYKGQFKDQFTKQGYGVYTNQHGVKFCGNWVGNKLDGKSIADFDEMKSSPYVCDKSKTPQSKFTYTDPNNPITMGPTDAWEYYFNNADQQWYTRKKGDSAWIKMIAKLPDTKMQKALDTLNRYVDSQNVTNQLGTLDTKFKKGDRIKFDLGKAKVGDRIILYTRDASAFKKAAEYRIESNPDIRFVEQDATGKYALVQFLSEPGKPKYWIKNMFFNSTP